MTTAANAQEWGRAVLHRDEAGCRWAGCARAATDPAHCFSRWHPSVALVIEDGVGLCHKHHVRLDNMGRVEKRRVLRLLLGRKRYDELEAFATGVHLK